MTLGALALKWLCQSNELQTSRMKKQTDSIRPSSGRAAMRRSAGVDESVTPSDPPLPLLQVDIRSKIDHFEQRGAAMARQPRFSTTLAPTGAYGIGHRRLQKVFSAPSSDNMCKGSVLRSISTDTHPGSADGLDPAAPDPSIITRCLRHHRGLRKLHSEGGDTYMVPMDEMDELDNNNCWDMMENTSEIKRKTCIVKLDGCKYTIGRF